MISRKTTEKKRMNKKEIETAFIKSIPIMCSYLFVGMAYGMMMQEAGFK
jgi:predicted branched-subunit amino acid permease